jgi:hypothetical protein
VFNAKETPSGNNVFPMRVTRRGEVTTVNERPSKGRASAVRKKPAAKAPDRFGAAKPRTFELPSLLESAGRVKRGSGPEGGEALLTKAERERVTKLFGSMPAARSAALQKLLISVPDGAAQALLFKAIAARAPRIDKDERALDVVTRFAKLISKVPEAELLERATVLDLDSRVSTSDADLTHMWAKKGTIRGEQPHGEASDNDGLFQRFTATCGPTVIQMMRAQTDPVLAFAINSEGRTRDSITGEVARFQKSLLEEYGGIAIGRRESYVLARLHNAMGKLGLETRSLSAANITAVRAKYDGFPSEEDLARVKAAVVKPRDEMLEKYVTNITGAKYAQTTPPEGFARGQAWRHLASVETAVKKGFDVPFGLVEPDHWMLIVDVRGRDGAREFLVTDTDGGRTAWVKEKVLVDGSFAEKQFGLPKAGERPYIDSFYLPTGS